MEQLLPYPEPIGLASADNRHNSAARNHAKNDRVRGRPLTRMAYCRQVAAQWLQNQHNVYPKADSTIEYHQIAP